MQDPNRITKWAWRSVQYPLPFFAFYLTKALHSFLWDFERDCDEQEQGKGSSRAIASDLASTTHVDFWRAMSFLGDQLSTIESDQWAWAEHSLRMNAKGGGLLIGFIPSRTHVLWWLAFFTPPRTSRGLHFDQTFEFNPVGFICLSCLEFMLWLTVALSRISVAWERPLKLCRLVSFSVSQRAYAIKRILKQIPSYPTDCIV